jgi:hypothetical protein
MKGDNDGRREARKLFPKAKQSGIAAIAITAMLFGVDAKASYAAGTLQKAVPHAQSGAFALPDIGLIRDVLRYSPSTRTNSSISFSDQIAVGTNHYGAFLNVAAGQLPFWTLSARANDAVGCGDDKDGSFQCVNPKRVLSGDMDVAISTANTPAISDLSGYMVVAAGNLSSGPHESTFGVRYTDTPGHKDSDLVSGNNASTTPVGEPRIYAMMLAGLGLMGFVASRR